MPREVRSPGLSLFNLTCSNHNLIWVVYPVPTLGAVLDSGHSGGQKCPPAAMESSRQAKNLELDFSTQWTQGPGWPLSGHRVQAGSSVDTGSRRTPSDPQGDLEQRAFPTW